MPEPDPQPPQPRPVSVWRWFLLLLPSVLVLAPPMIMERMDANGRMEITAREAEIISMSFFDVAVLVCFVLGFFVEKRLRGKIKSVVWAINYGFLILIGNGVIFFVAIAAFGFLKL